MSTHWVEKMSERSACLSAYWNIREKTVVCQPHTVRSFRRPVKTVSHQLHTGRAPVVPGCTAAVPLETRLDTRGKIPYERDIWEWG